MQETPKFSDLPIIEKTGERHAWGVFGQGDQLGAVNLLTPERVKFSATLVRRGAVFCLSLPLNYPIDLYSGYRAGYNHHFTVGRGGWDDHLDNFAMQGSSQWDGLRHSRYREFGYYGGRQEEDLTEKGDLGMEHWAKHGIIGRGVLLDVAGHLEKQGSPVDPRKRLAITGALMADVAQAEGLSLMPGDILLLRTGWLSWHKGLATPQREALRNTLHPNEGGMECPGLDASQSTAGWLWDHRFSAIAADNPAVEALKVEAAVGFQHRRLIALQGMPIGELWDLDDLASDCAKDHVYEFMLVSAPLFAPGAAGSPPNAYAIK